MRLVEVRWGRLVSARLLHSSDAWLAFSPRRQFTVLTSPLVSASGGSDCQWPGWATYAMMVGMADEKESQRDVELLAIALKHATQVYKSRMTNGLQVLNHFLVAVAVLSAAYVSALNGKLHAVGCAIGLLGVVLSTVTYLVGRRRRDVSRLAEIPMKEIENRLADRLKIGSLRMTDRAEMQRSIWWKSSTLMANGIFTLAIIVSIAASSYALFSR
jgi:hypothetical protein